VLQHIAYMLSMLYARARPSVHLSVTWVDQSKTVVSSDYEIFTIW